MAIPNNKYPAPSWPKATTSGTRPATAATAATAATEVEPASASRLDPRVDPTASPPPFIEELGPSLVARKDGRTLKRMTLYLPADLAKRLAVHCAEHDVDMSTVVTESVKKHLG